MRNRFIRGEIVDDGGKPARGGILVAGEIKPKLEAALGREMGLSTLYKLLHRHN